MANTVSVKLTKENFVQIIRPFWRKTWSLGTQRKWKRTITHRTSKINPFYGIFDMVKAKLSCFQSGRIKVKQCWVLLPTWGLIPWLQTDRPQNSTHILRSLPSVEGEGCSPSPSAPPTVLNALCLLILLVPVPCFTASPTTFRTAATQAN